MFTGMGDNETRFGRLIRSTREGFTAERADVDEFLTGRGKFGIQLVMVGMGLFALGWLIWSVLS